MLDREFERVLIQADSLKAVNVIQDEIFRGSNSTSVRRIHVLLKLPSHRSLQHICREDNKLADKIVKTVRDKRIDLR